MSFKYLPSYANVLQVENMSLNLASLIAAYLQVDSHESSTRHQSSRSHRSGARDLLLWLSLAPPLKPSPCRICYAFCGYSRSKISKDDDDDNDVDPGAIHGVWEPCVGRSANKWSNAYFVDDAFHKDNRPKKRWINIDSLRRTSPDPNVDNPIWCRGRTRWTMVEIDIFAFSLTGSNRLLTYTTVGDEDDGQW